VDYQPVNVRARIGLIIPSSNRLVEPQLNRHAPDGVAVHLTRLRMTGEYHKPIADLLPDIAGAAGTLSDARCDPIVFQCTGTAMQEGVEAERGIVRKIESATGCRATTTASAAMAALEALGARRIVLVSPYPRETHEHELAFLTEAGFEIVGERSLGLEGSDAYCSAPPALWRDTVAAVRNDRADAYFVSCANIHSIDIIDELEAVLNRPVITSNQVALWHGLRLTGIGDSIPGLGKLLTVPLAEALVV
jgi:maleate isomerase